MLLMHLPLEKSTGEGGGGAHARPWALSSVARSGGAQREDSKRRAGLGINRDPSLQRSLRILQAA